MSQRKSGSNAGCLIAVVLALVCFVLPLGWSLWDEGVFDEDLAYDTTATALDADDTARIQQVYTDAAKAHGICYGWSVEAGTGAPQEKGSNLGLGVDVMSRPEECPRWIVMAVNYSYIYKEWSSVNVNASDNIQEFDVDPGALERAKLYDSLEPQGISELADLLGALPMLASTESGGALAAIPAREQTTDPTASSNDELSPVHGFGWYFWLALGAVLVLLGLIWIISGTLKARKAERP
ncbi:hypothetical protein EDD29_0385 [Actinocorallia herbida]|uniref:Uncharacterized protein n=1 Tax=Actinocorallia herbida TaxID=58109 RepID=A0A3N1CNK8_9ACTN|nr:hypothetical protein [Actinocorallia herbida]ROO82900.1 hypothetical protein EDD29_0385 [Actinocorallia herbida]